MSRYSSLVDGNYTASIVYSSILLSHINSDGLSIESPKGEKKARLIPLALLVPFPNLFENLVLLLGG